jgi:hypothetical protein
MPDATQPGPEQNPELLKAMIQRIFGAAQPGATPPFFGTTMHDPSSAPAAAATPAPGGMTSAAGPGSSAPSAGPSPTSPGYRLPSAPGGGEAPGAFPKPGVFSAGAPVPPVPTGESAPPAPVMSESDWNRANAAPEHTPYVAPDLKHRMLEGLFAGMQEFGHRGEGAETVRDYLGNIRAQQEQEKTYPQRAAAEQHAGYERYIQGQKGPLDIKDLQAQITERESVAQKNNDTHALEREYYKAVTAGDDDKAQRYADAIGELRGELKPEKNHTPYGDWRTANPRAPVTDWLKAEQDAKGKGHTNPFEAFAYGTPEEKKAAQDFIAFEKQQGAKNERPGEVEQRYALFLKDPEAFKAMYGDRGGAQEQGQAARMLKFFDGQRKQIQGDFTLDEQTKQQKLTEIQELEKPYLDAAKVGGAAGKKNAGGTHDQGPRAGEVEVTGPNGEHGYIPRANLAKATQRGWKQVQ